MNLNKTLCRAYLNSNFTKITNITITDITITDITIILT